jgi:hypothetical protein
MGLLPMVSELRVIHLVLSLGFAIEGAIGAYTHPSRGYRLPYAALSRSDRTIADGFLNASVA